MASLHDKRVSEARASAEGAAALGQMIQANLAQLAQETFAQSGMSFVDFLQIGEPRVRQAVASSLQRGFKGFAWLIGQQSFSRLLDWIQTAQAKVKPTTLVMTKNGKMIDTRTVASNKKNHQIATNSLSSSTTGGNELLQRHAAARPSSLHEEDIIA